MFGGWLRRTLSHRWKKGWKRSKASSKDAAEEVKGEEKDGERGRKEVEEEEDTRSENDSAYESLPGSARGVGGGDTSRELSQSPSWEKQKESWDSLSSSRGETSSVGGKWAAPTSIIKPGGEGIAGGRQPKKKVSFPERDLKSEGGVAEERKVKGGMVRSEKRGIGSSNGWVRREGREGWVRRGDLEIESKREQEGVRTGLRRRELGGSSSSRVKEVASSSRLQGSEVAPRYLVPREVTRYRGGSQSVASQVEVIREETRAWLRSTFPR